MMDSTLVFYRSILHLPPWERRERMEHLPESECDRVRMIVEREDATRRLEEAIAGRDLVQVALADPSEITGNLQLKLTLLGRTIFSNDEDSMVARITNNIEQTSWGLISYIAGFDRHAKAFCLDAWKLVYCDICYIDGDSAMLQKIYEARLREEELQTPAARARELVRDRQLKKARRNARWMIPAIESSSTERQPQPDQEVDECIKSLLDKSRNRAGMERFLEEPENRQHVQRLFQNDDNEDIQKRIWKQVSPAPPAWIQEILDAQEHWGFVYYLSREVDQKYGRNWRSTWNRIENTCSQPGVTLSSIHCQGRDNWMSLSSLETQNWPIFVADDKTAEDDDLRKHFKEYSNENRSKTQEDIKKRKLMEKKKYRNMHEYTDVLSPGLLRNTFIVIPIELVDGNRKIQEEDFLDPYWVWAYDADWDSSEEETTFNGEKYQGRMKVAKWSLESWFYAARWEGVSLRDMWLKAQQHPEKLWICYTKALEDWDHEPYI